MRLLSIFFALPLVGCLQLADEAPPPVVDDPTPQEQEDPCPEPTFTLTPSTFAQGEQASVEIEGCGTAFEEAEGVRTVLDAGFDACVNEVWPNCQDPRDPGGELQVVSAEIAAGAVHVSNGAAVGPRDVVVRVLRDEDLNGDGAVTPGEFTVLHEVTLLDGLEITATHPDCTERVFARVDLTATRTFDPVTCGFDEVVVAEASFFEPLDPPCGAAGTDPGLDQTNVTRLEPAVCPSPPTCDAGRAVVLERSGERIEALGEVLDGRRVYRAEPAAFPFGGPPFDLHVEGTDDGVQGFTVEEALSVPAVDAPLLGPLPCGGTSFPADEDLVVEWTPADSTPLLSMGTAALALQTWAADDGEYTFDAQELSYLTGPAELIHERWTASSDFFVPGADDDQGRGSSNAVIRTVVPIQLVP